MRLTLDLNTADGYRTFLKVKALPVYRFAGREAWFPDEYADRVCGAAPKAAGRKFKPASHLFDYQRDIAALAVRRQKFAAFVDCGLGKTLIAAEFARHALDVLPKSRCGLIVSPPLVIDQTIREFSRFYGDALPVERVRGVRATGRGMLQAGRFWTPFDKPGGRVPAEELTPLQDAAILAVLTCRTLRLAAKKAGVSHQTLYNWLDDPAFQRGLTAARKRLVSHAVSQLAQVATDAVAALKRNLTAKGNPGVQVRAAVGLLDQLVKVGAVADLAAEVAELREEMRRNADARGGDAGTGVASEGSGEPRPENEPGPRPTPGGPDAAVPGDGVGTGPVAGGVPEQPSQAGIPPLFPAGGEVHGDGGAGGA